MERSGRDPSDLTLFLDTFPLPLRSSRAQSHLSSVTLSSLVARALTDQCSAADGEARERERGRDRERRERGEGKGKQSKQASSRDLSVDTFFDSFEVHLVHQRGGLRSARSCEVLRRGGRGKDSERESAGKEAERGRAKSVRSIFLSRTFV